MENEYSLFFPPPNEIFEKHELPVVEVTKTSLLCYGETELENWFIRTFNLKPYTPPVNHDKIQKEIEKLVIKDGVDELEIKRVLIDKDNSGCVILRSRLPRPMRILNENNEEILSLWLTPYKRDTYIISEYETTEIDLWKLLRHAPRPSFEEFLERIENYFREFSEESTTLYTF